MRLSAKSQNKNDNVWFIDLDSNSDEDRPILKRTLTWTEKNAEKVEKIKKDFKASVQNKKSLKVVVKYEK